MSDRQNSPSAKGIDRLQPIGQTSFVVAAAKALRDEILRRSDDDLFLGSEDDLIERLGVSQPTFRQAARLLEYEELLTVRRGVGGGYFGRRPSAEVVARMAGIYLLSQGTTFTDVLQTQWVLDDEVIRRIAANADPEVRRTLGRYVAQHADDWSQGSVADGVRGINGFWRMAIDLAGNRSLALFSLASQAYGAKSASLSLTPERVAIYTSALRRMCGAIERGDVDEALAIRREGNSRMIEWADEGGIDPADRRA